jgi:uncharacterized protein
VIAEFINLTNEQILLSIVIIFLSYVVKGLTGFGSGLIAIPLLAFIFPLKFIVPLFGLLSYAGTIIQSISLRKQAAWKDILPLIPFSLMGISVALWLLINIRAETLTLFLGFFIVAYAIYSLLPDKKLSGGRKWAIVAGGCGGLVGALFGTGGPFYVIYLKLRQLDKSQFRASISMVFLFDGGSRVVAYAGTGLYSEQIIYMVIMLLPVLLMAMYVGNHIHIKINEYLFNRMINILLLVSGSLLIIKSVN